MKRDAFAACHPVVNFLYFLLVIGCSMFVMHPIFLCLSVVGGMAYYVYLKGRKAWKTSLRLMLPVFLLTAVLNPLFSHEGTTLLTYLPSGNPLTLESILYGLGAGAMLVCVINWFSCYQEVMTSDKFIYLFGRIIPSLSLVLSMVLRFVPKFRIQIEQVSQAQKCIGRDVSNGTILEKSRHGMKILSIMTTWALENSVDTADSMRSRGYGLRGRVNYALFRFDGRDRFLCGLCAVLGLVVVAGIATKTVFFRYYPAPMMNPLTAWSLLVYLCYGALCLLPLLLNVIEDLKWHYLKSKI